MIAEETKGPMNADVFPTYVACEQGCLEENAEQTYY